MKKLVLFFMLLMFIGAPVFAQNSCENICNSKCKGQSINFVSCHDACKRNCVATKTGNTTIDKQNYCENKCAGQGATFQTCYNSCLSTYKD